MKKLAIAVAAIAILLAAGYGWYRSWYKYQYPYGYNHCCDKVLHLALWNYAEAHNGVFPAGEATPEASLSLICRWCPEAIDAHTLAGKTGSEAATQAVLDRGELLGPDTCGWHYVEGLRLDSDPRLALFWDKDGLGHDSQRLSGGGHEVCRISGGPGEHVTADCWESFLAEQQKLLEIDKVKRAKNTARANAKQPEGAASVPRQE